MEIVILLLLVLILILLIINIFKKTKIENINDKLILDKLNNINIGKIELRNDDIIHNTKEIYNANIEIDKKINLLDNNIKNNFNNINLINNNLLSVSEESNKNIISLRNVYGSNINENNIKLNNINLLLTDNNKLILSESSKINNNINSVENKNNLILSDTSKINNNLDLALNHVSEMKIRLSEKAEQDLSILNSINNLESIISGSGSKGAAGEAMLENILKVIPADLQVRNFKVNGKVVEFGVKINNKILVIDSKVVANNLFDKYNLEKDELEKLKIQSLIESQVYNKAKEVSKYLDPSISLNIGIAVVQNSIYDLIPKTIIQSYNDFNVLILNYSMLLPYILIIQQYEVKNNKEIDLDKLENYLQASKDSLVNLQDEIESRLSKSIVMLTNSRDAIRVSVSKLNSGIDGIVKNKS